MFAPPALTDPAAVMDDAVRGELDPAGSARRELRDRARSSRMPRLPGRACPEEVAKTARTRGAAMKKTAAILVIVLGFACGIAGCSKRDGRIVLKAADDHEISYPTTQGLVRMGELLAEWTKGRITVEVHASAQLGSEKETIELTQMGAIDINRVNVNPVTQIVPEFKVLALPYIFEGADHMHRVLDGEIGEELLGRLKGHRLVGLGYYDSGQRSFYATKPLRSMADLAGLKIRVQKAEIMVDMTRAVGASSTPMAFEEVYTALQTGVIDGAENNYPSYITKGHYEAAKHYMQDEHSRVPEIILFSKKRWDGLSEEDQSLVARAAKESVPHQRRLWEAKAADSIGRAREAGCTIVTDVDKAPFARAMKAVYEKHAPGLAEYVRRIRAER